jgi:hypothetical protein
MNLNDLLLKKGIEPRHVLVLRHRPQEPELNRVFPWLASERPDLFNAYQQTHRERVERMMEQLKGNGYVASFVGREAGRALFVGLYAIAASKPLTYKEFWQVPGFIELKALGMKGWELNEARPSSVLWFDLVLTDFFPEWKGKLIVSWPAPERVWCRRAHRNEFPIVAILEESVLEAAMPMWNELELTWEQLRVLPARWRSALSQWRGVYYIFDTSDGKGYVGSAYGESNLLGRWLNYAARGHGGNSLLRKRRAQDFRFSILQRVSPDLDPTDVIRLEGSWKRRLHTLTPYGLNEN